MTVAVKKQGLRVPQAITRKAGIKPGDVVELTVRQGTIKIQAAPIFDESGFPIEKATKAEIAAMRRGWAAFKRGDYISLEELHREMDALRQRSRRKVARKAS